MIKIGDYELEPFEAKVLLNALATFCALNPSGFAFEVATELLEKVTELRREHARHDTD